VFIAWILDQQEREDLTGDCARAIFSDINNGCSSTAIKSPVDWKRHFEEYHSKVSVQVLVMLTEAYISYLNSFSDEN